MPPTSEKHTRPPPRPLVFNLSLLSISHCTRSKGPDLTLHVSLLRNVATLPPRSVPLSLIPTTHPCVLGSLLLFLLLLFFFSFQRSLYSDQRFLYYSFHFCLNFGVANVTCIGASVRICPRYCRDLLLCHSGALALLFLRRYRHFFRVCKVFDFRHAQSKRTRRT